jgi:hypothetical protein
MTIMDEKTADIHLITRNVSATSTICPYSTCPSKRPMAYSSTPQSRKRSCSGCSQKASTTPAPPGAPQVLSSCFRLLDDALSGTAMERPAHSHDADRNIQAHKLVLKEVKASRQSSHLSRRDKKALERELKPMEDDVKGVLKDLKREKARIRGG